jgi:rod shape-determining protein MreD
MVRLLLLGPVVYLAAVAETALADVLRIGAVAPAPLCLAGVIWLLAVDRRGPFWNVAAMGLAEDLLAPGRVGPGLAAMLLVGYLVAQVRRRLAADHNLPQSLLTGAAVMLAALLVALARWLLGEVPAGLLATAEQAAAVGTYTAALAIPLLLVLTWTKKEAGGS